MIGTGFRLVIFFFFSYYWSCKRVKSKDFVRQLYNQRPCDFLFSFLLLFIFFFLQKLCLSQPGFHLDEFYNTAADSYL